MANQKEKQKGQDPAVLFYTKDFLVSTFTLTYEQKGKYITLLCLQHQKGKLTKNDLQSVLTEEDWEIAEKFPLADDGYYYNKRMADEAFKRANFVDSRRSNGSNGGRPKGSIKTEKKPNGLPNGNLMAKLKETYNKPNENLPGNANATVNVNLDANTDVDTDVDTDVSDSTKNIIDKSLETLIEYDIHPEQYDKALQTIMDIGGIDKALNLMGYEGSVKEKWTNKILEVSKSY